jgi:hypothetical protein
MGQGKSINCPSLGTIICGDSSCGPEINRRIGLGYGSIAKMKNKIYGSKYVPWPTQVAIYETITLPIVLYGCKAWATNQGSLDMLEAFNNAACRRINNRNLWLWHMWEYGITSAELLQRVGLQTMTQYIAKQQLSWLGHVAHIPPSRSPK